MLRCDASCVVLLCRSAPRRKTSLVEETPHDVDGGRGHDGRQRPTCHDVVGIAMREYVTAGAPAGASSNVNLENPIGGKDSDEMQRRTWTKASNKKPAAAPLDKYVERFIGKDENGKTMERRAFAKMTAKHWATCHDVKTGDNFTILGIQVERAKVWNHEAAERAFTSKLGLHLMGNMAPRGGEAFESKRIVWAKVSAKGILLQKTTERWTTMPSVQRNKFPDQARITDGMGRSAWGKELWTEVKLGPGVTDDPEGTVIMQIIIPANKRKEGREQQRDLVLVMAGYISDTALAAEWHVTPSLSPRTPRMVGDNPRCSTNCPCSQRILVQAAEENLGDSTKLLASMWTADRELWVPPPLEEEFPDKPADKPAEQQAEGSAEKDEAAKEKENQTGMAAMETDDTADAASPAPPEEPGSVEKRAKIPRKKANGKGDGKGDGKDTQQQGTGAAMDQDNGEKGLEVPRTTNTQQPPQLTRPPQDYCMMGTILAGNSFTGVTRHQCSIPPEFEDGGMGGTSWNSIVFRMGWKPSPEFMNAFFEAVQRVAQAIAALMRRNGCQDAAVYPRWHEQDSPHYALKQLRNPAWQLHFAVPGDLYVREDDMKAAIMTAIRPKERCSLMGKSQQEVQEMIDDGMMEWAPGTHPVALVKTIFKEPITSKVLQIWLGALEGGNRAINILADCVMQIKTKRGKWLMYGQWIRRSWPAPEDPKKNIIGEYNACGTANRGICLHTACGKKITNLVKCVQGMPPWEEFPVVADEFIPTTSAEALALAKSEQFAKEFNASMQRHIQIAQEAAAKAEAQVASRFELARAEVRREKELATVKKVTSTPQRKCMHALRTSTAQNRCAPSTQNVPSRVTHHAQNHSMTSLNAECTGDAAGGATRGGGEGRGEDGAHRHPPPSRPRHAGQAKVHTAHGNGGERGRDNRPQDVKDAGGPSSVTRSGRTQGQLRGISRGTQGGVHSDGADWRNMVLLRPWCAAPADIRISPHLNGRVKQCEGGAAQHDRRMPTPCIQGGLHRLTAHIRHVLRICRRWTRKPTKQREEKAPRKGDRRHGRRIQGGRPITPVRGDQELEITTEVLKMPLRKDQIPLLLKKGKVPALSRMPPRVAVKGRARARNNPNKHADATAENHKGVGREAGIGIVKESAQNKNTI